MSGQALDSRPAGPQAAVELQREQQVGELGLPVGAPARVAALGLEVVEVDAPHLVRVAAQRHHAGVGVALHEADQATAEREVAE